MSEKKEKNEETLNTIVGPGSVFAGEFIIAGGARIDGIVKGPIQMKGTLLVGESGNIVAPKIEASSAVIGGIVEAQLLLAPEKVHLRSTAKFTGTIKTKTLVIDEGAKFQGTSVLP